MKTLPVGSTIGIVGGGQLGRMTRAAASELGFKTLILSNNKDGCAFNDGSRHIIAPYDDDGALETFVRQCSVITIEFESLPPSIFDAVHEIGQGKVPMYPSRIALETSQNRRREKMMAKSLRIPVPKFWTVEKSKDLDQEVEFPVIIKTAEGGYDGKGQGRAENIEKLRELWKGFGSVPCVCEEVVDYDFEFSVILARNELGEMVCYPPCRNVHKGGILRETFWPLSNGKDIDRRFSEEEAFKCTKKIAEHLNVVGLLTVEFFFTKDGRILFNEIAPRAHNSGHVTMGGAAYTSQFEQHIRSICGMPFGSTEPRNGGGHMINILGNGDLYDAEIQVPHSKVHWYGKVPRGDEHQKLGHIVRTNW